MDLRKELPALGRYADAIDAEVDAQITDADISALAAAVRANADAIINGNVEHPRAEALPHLGTLGIAGQIEQ